MYLPLSEQGDAGEQYYDTDTGAMVTVIRTENLQRANYERQKESGFTPGHEARRVASIDLNLVNYLAKNGDSDAYMYLYEHDIPAMYRMVKRYPEYFKACYGGI